MVSNFLCDKLLLYDWDKEQNLKIDSIIILIVKDMLIIIMDDKG